MDDAVKEILEFYNQADAAALAARADKVCREHYGNKVFARGLVEFSNYCSRDCLYCGIRRSHAQVQRYRLGCDDIVRIVKAGFRHGFRTFVLQSGEDNHYRIKQLTALVEKIADSTNGEAALTLSCGVLAGAHYKSLKHAGANRYLLRFETADPVLHAYLRNGIPLKRRLRALTELKELGFEVGSGYMVGLPGESAAARINNALLCRELELDMVGIGPFIPHPRTPLKAALQCSLEYVLSATSLVRLLLPAANIPATTATGTLDPLGREKALEAGANVIMVNITPAAFKQHYLLYPGKICLDEDGFKCLGCIGSRIRGIDKVLVTERGDALSWTARQAG